MPGDRHCPQLWSFDPPLNISCTNYSTNPPCTFSADPVLRRCEAFPKVTRTSCVVKENWRDWGYHRANWDRCPIKTIIIDTVVSLPSSNPPLLIPTARHLGPLALSSQPTHLAYSSPLWTLVLRFPLEPPCLKPRSPWIVRVLSAGSPRVQYSQN